MVITRIPAPRGRRKNQDSLTREQICAAALVLLRDKGIDGFSVRDLAKSLNVYPTAIYWHMATRNDLLAEVAAYALRDMTPPPGEASWQQWLRELFIRYRKAIRENPAVAPLIGARIVSNGGVGPDLIEAIFGALANAGFRADDILDAFNVVIAAKVGFVTLEFAPQPEDSLKWRQAMQQRIHAVDAKQHPLLAHYLPQFANRAFMLRWDNGSTAPLDRSFDTYVDVVIEGLSAMLSRTTGLGQT